MVFDVRGGGERTRCAQTKVRSVCFRCDSLCGELEWGEVCAKVPAHTTTRCLHSSSSVSNHLRSIRCVVYGRNCVWHASMCRTRWVLQPTRSGYLATLSKVRADTFFPALYCCALVWCRTKTGLCCTATHSQSKALAEENAALRSLTGKLEGELEEIKTVRARSLVNDGAELQVRAQNPDP